jgi:hypothetical protein
MSSLIPDGFALELAQLTDRGIERFQNEALALAKQPGADRQGLRKVVSGIIGDGESCEPIENGGTLPFFAPLTTRKDTAVLAAAALTGVNEDDYSARRVFSWMALALLPSLLRERASGGYKVLAEEKYVMKSSSTLFYRHLVACPFWAYSVGGGKENVYLPQRAFIHPDITEQTASRWVLRRKAVLQVMGRLYFDPSRSAGVKAGCTDVFRIDSPPPGMNKTSPKPGTVRALDIVCSQIACNYDLDSMNTDQLLDLLPPEFDSWLTPAP